MVIIESTIRTKRAYVENIRKQFIALDKVLFRNLDEQAQPEVAYRTIQLAPHRYAVVLDDPSIASNGENRRPMRGTET